MGQAHGAGPMGRAHGAGAGAMLLAKKTLHEICTQKNGHAQGQIWVDAGQFSGNV